jgi:hypothetical protein
MIIRHGRLWRIAGAQQHQEARMKTRVSIKAQMADATPFETVVANFGERELLDENLTSALTRTPPGPVLVAETENEKAILKRCYDNAVVMAVINAHITKNDYEHRFGCTAGNICIVEK